MKTKILFLSIFVFVFSNCTQQKKEATKIGNVQDSVSIITKPYKNAPNAIEYEIPVLKGTNIRHGIQKRYYLHGSLYSEIPYSNGKRNGIAITFYPVVSGAEPIIWKEQPYLNHMLEGICKRFHKDGSLQAEYEYKNGFPGTGLKEYYPSGKLVNLPELVVSSSRTEQYFYITAKLTNNKKKVDYFIGELIEGKYLPDNLKGLQVKDGVGEILVPLSTKKVTITAVHFTDYQNRHILSKTITF